MRPRFLMGVDAGWKDGEATVNEGRKKVNGEAGKIVNVGENDVGKRRKRRWIKLDKN